MKGRNILVILALLIVALTSATVATGAQLSDYFKTTAWVAQHANDENFVIVDTRSTGDYDAGHIPGAISIPRAHSISPGTLSIPKLGLTNSIPLRNRCRSLMIFRPRRN